MDIGDGQTLSACGLNVDIGVVPLSKVGNTFELSVNKGNIQVGQKLIPSVDMR